MCAKSLIISTYDKERLERKIEQVRTDAEGGKAHLELGYVTQLAEEISQARIVAPEQLPADAVSMNSVVELVDTERGSVHEYALVFPAESDPSTGRISILAPLGIALLGCKVNDVVRWSVPKGECSYRIQRLIYQPEANGEYTK